MTALVQRGVLPTLEAPDDTGKAVIVNPAGDNYVLGAAQSGASVPSPEAGDAGKTLTVNQAEDGYELAPPSGGGGAQTISRWTGYSGTISTDTSAALTGLVMEDEAGDDITLRAGGEYFDLAVGLYFITVGAYITGSLQGTTDLQIRISTGSTLGDGNGNQGYGFGSASVVALGKPAVATKMFVADEWADVHFIVNPLGATAPVDIFGGINIFKIS